MEDKVDEITLIKNMNIYKKMQRVKNEISKRELTKSGKNDYSGFTYYELGDFMPSIISLCDKYGLFTKVDFVDFKDEDTMQSTKEADGSENTIINYREKQKAVLTIINSDNPTEKEIFSCDVKELNLKGANSIQNYGGIQTYLRRYIYMNAFDIVEADMFDAEEFEKKKKKQKIKGDLEVLFNMTKKAFINAEEKDKKQMAELMKKLGYKTFKEVEEKSDVEDIKALAIGLKVEIPDALTKTDNKGK